MVAGKHIELVVAAQDGNSARILRGAAQDLLVQLHVDNALIDIAATIDHACAVVGTKGEAVLDALEHFFELGGGTSAGGAEYDASFGELVQAFVKALRQHALVGQQRLVHVDGDELNVSDIGVRFVSLHKSEPFVSKLFQTL